MITQSAGEPRKRGHIKNLSGITPTSLIRICLILFLSALTFGCQPSGGNDQAEVLGLLEQLHQQAEAGLNLRTYRQSIDSAQPIVDGYLRKNKADPTAELIQGAWDSLLQVDEWWSKREDVTNVSSLNHYTMLLDTSVESAGRSLEMIAIMAPIYESE